MKTFDLKSLMMGALLTMTIVVITILVTSESRPRAWDYRIVQGYMGSDFQDQIHHAGQDGWEVVSVSVVPNPPNTARPFAVMKRARTEPRVAWWRFWKK